ncbi:Uncharacterised protein [Chromobacterium violaceum]|uniref:Uncharacterized protein n=1 Tax=Chromobacterium violaceum TaxID=536 RepID=A0A3S4HUC0_CHRVL|nr:Uncharacterised protein [Chromobacterium violaceum]
MVGIGLALAYVLLGASWLVMKTHGKLQAKAIRWRGSACTARAPRWPRCRW